MKNWWLKLYTVPILKKMLKLFGACGIGDLIFTLAGFDDAFIISLLYCVPVFVFWSQEVKQGMVRNLPFHKLTLPFPEIKRALLCHYGIVVPSSVFLALLMCILSEFLGGSAKGLDSFPALSTILGVAVIIFVFSFVSLGNSKNFQNFKVRIQGNFIVQILFALVCYASFMVFMFGLISLNFDMNITMFLAAFGIIFSVGLYRWRAMFHLVPAQITKKLSFKYNSIGVLAGLAVFCMVALIGKNDHLDDSISKDNRAMRLMFFQPFSGDIDQSTFQELEPFVDPVSAEQFYALAPKSIGEIPIQNFIDAKNKHRVIFFIAHGNPSKKNLEFMVSHLERNKEQWKKIDPRESVANALVNNWPKGMPVPESLVDVKLRREIASKGKPKVIPGKQDPVK